MTLSIALDWIYLSSRVNYIENEGIVAIPLDSKIFDVFKSLNPAKSPGPNGMSTAFFQNYWNFVGLDVCKVIQNVLSSSQLPKALNRTFVVLIPKVK